MPNAWPHLSPFSKATRCKPTVGFQMNGTMAFPVFEDPAISPTSLMADAELYSPPGKTPKFLSCKLPRLHEVARICPAPELPDLPTRSPRLFNRLGTWATPAAGSCN